MSHTAHTHPLPTRPASAAASIPLDPTAEAAAVSAAYTQSRVARLMAVRLQSKADAALARQSFRDAKRKEAMQIATQRAFEAEVEATKHSQAIARALAEASEQLGAAHRDAALEAEMISQRKEAAEVRKAHQDSLASSRFDHALSQVQARAKAAAAAKAERAALKAASKEAEKLVRAQMERAAARAANQTPKHLLEYQRMTSPGYTPRPTSARAAAGAAAVASSASISPPASTASTLHVSGKATTRSRGLIPGGLSPATPFSEAGTPSAASAVEGVEDEEFPAPPPLAAIPTPHPHPLARKHTFNVKPQPTLTPTPETPKVAVALNFSSPAAPASVSTPATQERASEGEEEKQPDALSLDPSVVLVQEAAAASKQAALLVAHDRVLSHARMHRARGGYQPAVCSPPPRVASATTRRKQEQAFEIVIKQGKEIVSQRIGGAEAEPATTTTSRANSRKKQPASANAAAASTDRKSPSAVPTRRPASARSVPRTPRSSTPSISIRKRAVKPVPILVPNAAFFAAQQQNFASVGAAAPETDLFHPQITCGGTVHAGSELTTPNKKRGLAWIIQLASTEANLDPASESNTQQQQQQQLSGDSSSKQQPAEPHSEVQPTATPAPSVPALRGLHLVAALEKQRNDRMAAQEAALHLTPSPAAVAGGPTPSAAASAAPSALTAPSIELGSRYFAPQDSVTDQIIHQHEQATQDRASSFLPVTPRTSGSATVGATSSEVFSSPLFPLASAAAAKVADAARTATPRAPGSQQPPRSAVRSSTTTPAVDLDRQLRSILAQQLKHDATATKLIFSPHTAVAASSAAPSGSQALSGVYGDDSDFSDSDDEDGGAHLPLASFTSPAGAAPYASSASFTPAPPPFSRAAPASSFTPCSPLTPLAASLVASDPTSATDLFIEQIHYVLATEAKAKREVDAIIEEARRQRTPAPAPAPAQADTRTQESPKENTQEKTEAAPTPNLLSPTAFLRPQQQQQHPLLTPSSKQQQLQQLLTPSQGPVTPASAGHGGLNSSFVPSSVDRKALLSVFSSLSADELLAAKPTRTHSLFGSSIPATPNDASFMHTPMRSPQQLQPQQLLSTPPRRLQASFDSMH